MRSFIFTLLFLSNLLIVGYVLPAVGDEGVTLYKSPAVAQKHCPDDEVVWLNPGSGIWHIQGSRWYGSTNHGAYVCEKEAAAAGNRASRSGA